jgi:hypothetical protein
MAQLEISREDVPLRAWQFSLNQMLVTVTIASLLLVLGLKGGYWGVGLGLVVMLGARLLYVANRDRWQFSATQLIVSNACVALILGLALSAGFLGLVIGVIYLLVALLCYVLTRCQWKVVRGILIVIVEANVISWACVGSVDEKFLLLPYQGAANFNLDFALICGDAAQMEQLSQRKRREAICAHVPHIYYEGNTGFTFGQIGHFGKWHEDQLQVSQSHGLHFNAETILHTPMLRVVKEEILGRGLFGSGSDVLYVWWFDRWVRVYDDVRWFC